MNNNVVKFSFVLMLTAGVAIAGVAVVFGISKPKILEAKEKSQKQVMALAFNMKEEEFKQLVMESLGENAWKVSRSGEVVGYAAKGSASGYGGDVEVIAAFKPDLKTLIGAAVMDVSRETPGLGQNAKQKKPTSTWLQTIFGIREVQPEEGSPLDSYTFMGQFQDREQGELKLAGNRSEGIVAMTGATITSDAVIRAVNDALKKLQTERR